MKRNFLTVASLLLMSGMMLVGCGNSGKDSGGGSGGGEGGGSGGDSSTLVLNIYLKKNNENVSWWNNDDAVSYLHTWDEGFAAFTRATFIQTYDENTTLYFTVEFEDAVPTNVLMIRANPSVITETPTSWPSDGVWNQTEDGEVEQDESGNYYVDLTIK